MATLPGKHIPQNKRRLWITLLREEQAAWSLEENPWALTEYYQETDRKNETEIKKIPIQNVFYIVKSKDFKGHQHLVTHKDFVGTLICARPNSNHWDYIVKKKVIKDIQSIRCFVSKNSNRRNLTIKTKILENLSLVRYNFLVRKFFFF